MGCLFFLKIKILILCGAKKPFGFCSSCTNVMKAFKFLIWGKRLYVLFQVETNKILFIGEAVSDDSGTLKEVERWWVGFGVEEFLKLELGLVFLIKKGGNQFLSEFLFILCATTDFVAT